MIGLKITKKLLNNKITISNPPVLPSVFQPIISLTQDFKPIFFYAYYSNFSLHLSYIYEGFSQESSVEQTLVHFIDKEINKQSSCYNDALGDGSFYLNSFFPPAYQYGYWKYIQGVNFTKEYENYSSVTHLNLDLLISLPLALYEWITGNIIFPFPAKPESYEYMSNFIEELGYFEIPIPCSPYSEFSSLPTDECVRRLISEDSKPIQFKCRLAKYIFFTRYTKLAYYLAKTIYLADKGLIPYNTPAFFYGSEDRIKEQEDRLLNLFAKSLECDCAGVWAIKPFAYLFKTSVEILYNFTSGTYDYLFDQIKRELKANLIASLLLMLKVGENPLYMLFFAKQMENYPNANPCFSLTRMTLLNTFADNFKDIIYNTNNILDDAQFYLTPDLDVFRENAFLFQGLPDAKIISPHIVEFQLSNNLINELINILKRGAYVYLSVEYDIKLSSIILKYWENPAELILKGEIGEFSPIQSVLVTNKRGEHKIYSNTLSPLFYYIACY